MIRKLNLEEIQRALLDVMIIFDSYCRAHSLKYYLIGGSLLGAVRHKGFIPWDDDMDVGMERKEYERFLEFAKKEPLSCELKNYRCDNHCDYVITRLYIDKTRIDNPIITHTLLDKRLYFDIFPLDYIPDSPDDVAMHSKSVMKKKKLLSYVDLRNYNNNLLILCVKKMLSCVQQSVMPR